MWISLLWWLQEMSHFAICIFGVLPMQAKLGGEEFRPLSSPCFLIQKRAQRAKGWVNSPSLCREGHSAGRQVL